MPSSTCCRRGRTRDPVHHDRLCIRANPQDVILRVGHRSSFDPAKAWQAEGSLIPIFPFNCAFVGCRTELALTGVTEATEDCQRVSSASPVTPVRDFC